MFSLKKILNQDTTLKPLVSLLTQQQSLNNIWLTIAPDLQHLSQATSLDGETLTVVTHSGLVANKIKLMTPELIAAFNASINLNRLPSQLCNLTAIKVKVQVKSSLKQSTKRITGLSRVAAEELVSFAQTTKNQALKEKLLKISGHVRTASDGLKSGSLKK